jgi:gliding motility-associated-like protein
MQPETQIPRQSTQATLWIQSSSFKVTINQASGQADPTNTFPITFDVLFGHQVTDFSFDDITWSGTAGTISGNISGTGNSYKINVSGASSDGTMIPLILAQKVHDALNNSNLASTSSDNNVTIDRTKPSVEINLESSQLNPTNSTIISFDANFSESIPVFGAAAVQLTGTTGASTIYVRGGPKDYIIDISGMNVPGNVVVNIPDNAVTDLAGNYNSASKNTANTVYYDNVKPNVTISTNVVSPPSLTQIPINIEFTKVVTGFEISDINITNANISDFREINVGTLWEAIISPVSTGKINMQIPADAAKDNAGNSNNASNHFQIDYVEASGNFEASNIFTPNSALNRYWIIKNIQKYTDYELVIRNSAGQLIYQTTNYQNDWNGTYKNKSLPTGTYYYSFSSADKKTNYKGFINIIYE